MDHTPLVSVLIPMHNAAPWLEQCIGSVLRQTVQDFEIVLVDDGSDDGSAELADRLAAQHACLRVIHRDNCGVSAGRNTSLKEARGSLLLPLDADDWLEPDCIETLLALREKYHTPVTACNHFIDEGSSPRPAFPDEEEKVLDAHDSLRGVLYHGVPDVSCWGKLWERDLFEGLTYPEGRIYEDTWMIAPLLLRAGSIAWTPKCCCHYRIRPDSISRSVWAQDKLDFPEAVEALCSEAEKAYPDLAQACERRRCHAWLSLRRYFVNCSGELKEQRNDVERHALSYSRAVLRDPHAPRRDKLALRALRVGSWCFDLMWRAYTGRRSGR